MKKRDMEEEEEEEYKKMMETQMESEEEKHMHLSTLEANGSILWLCCENRAFSVQVDPRSTSWLHGEIATTSISPH